MSTHIAPDRYLSDLDRQARQLRHDWKAVRRALRRLARVLAVVVSLVLLAGLLAACGGTSTPQATPSDAQAAASRVAACRAALAAEHARWVRDPSQEVNPSECDQPGVSHADYLAAFAAVGGAVWIADE